jgi:hypothetical protein
MIVWWSIGAGVHVGPHRRADRVGAQGQD